MTPLDLLCKTTDDIAKGIGLEPNGRSNAALLDVNFDDWRIVVRNESLFRKSGVLDSIRNRFINLLLDIRDGKVVVRCHADIQKLLEPIIREMVIWARRNVH